LSKSGRAVHPDGGAPKDSVCAKLQ